MTVAGYALAALLHLALALYLLAPQRLRRDDRPGQLTLLAALLASAGWAASAALDVDAQHAGWRLAAGVLDALRYALWFALLLRLAGRTRERARALRVLGTLGVVLPLLALAQTAWRGAGGRLDAEPSQAVLAVALAMPVLGLVLIEQLFRNLREDSRWNAKPVCLGLAIVFVFDVYLQSDALLFGRYDADAAAVRGLVHGLAVPFVFVSARRRADWINKLQVSRAAAFYSATLLLAGLYLLFISGIGYYVRFFGGDWGRALQLGLLFTALAFGVALAISGSLRSWLRVFLGKHFFSYRYDYREEWLRFTALLSSGSSPQQVGELVVKGLAGMVECPAGALWLRSGGDGALAPSLRWNLPRPAGASAAEWATEPADSPFVAFLRDKGWVIDLDELRRAPRRYQGLTMPDWLDGLPDAWLVVPLQAGDGLLGFVLLAKPRTAMELNWEVRDLLKTAARQAAGHLAQMLATEALLEARKFEAFNRMSAFVVHDLKNIVTQLALMLKNAERLRDNPEFQQDMLLTVQSSLEKMRRLMLQLREGAKPTGGGRGVELAPIVQRLRDAATARGRELEVPELERLATRGHEDRLERVLGHLVDNAFDATPAEGRVWLSVSRYSGQVRVEVGDTGTGMSEDFVKNRLFKPFSTTKGSGMGIGSYESHQYIRELGGRIEVSSQPGAGTRIGVLLPLFESQQGSDLLPEVAD